MQFKQASIGDRTAVYSLYQSVKSQPFCAWDEEYPGLTNIDDDLKGGNLFVLEDKGELIGAISVVTQNELDDFTCWRVKEKTGEFARVVIRPDRQGKNCL